MSNHSSLHPLIIKLGGSLYNTTELILWLKALKNLSEHQSIIIVPGGGPFADQVRHAQSNHPFDDKVAHHMAILAMKQFGLLLMALETQCQAFHDNDNTVISPLSVWLPDDSLLTKHYLPHSWDISSDSLALYLAQKINASRLVLVKKVNTHLRSITELSSIEIIDAGFANLFSHSTISTQIIHYQQYEQFADIQHSIHNSLGLFLP